jgi:photosystem II stability/assembly factor-like uncharacterized protein
MVVAVAMFAVGHADWVSVGPAGGQIYSGTVTPGSPAVIYAASTNSSAPLLTSSDGGANWIPTAGALGSYPSVLASHPTDPNTVFGVAGSVFYRSTNAGANWSSFSFGSNTNGNDIAVNPLNPQVIYSAGYKYDGTAWRPSCMKSTNAGQNWTVSQLDTAASTTTYSCAIDPVDTNVVYAGGYVDTFTVCYKSVDCGATWTKYYFPTRYYYIYSFYISPTDRNIVFAGALNGICRSTDAGQTWTRQATCSYNYRIVAAPDNPNVMYSAAYSSVYRSTDAGLTWTNSNSGLQGTNVRTVLTVPGENGVVYCGSTAGMFKSTDYGLTWAPVNNGIIIGRIPVVAVSPEEPGVVFAEFIDNAIFKTLDEGNTWQRQPTVLSCGNVCGIAFDANNPLMRWMFEGSG